MLLWTDQLFSKYNILNKYYITINFVYLSKLCDSSLVKFNALKPQCFSIDQRVGCLCFRIAWHNLFHILTAFEYVGQPCWPALPLLRSTVTNGYENRLEQCKTKWLVQEYNASKGAQIEPMIWRSWEQVANHLHTRIHISK